MWHRSISRLSKLKYRKKIIFNLVKEQSGNIDGNDMIYDATLNDHGKVWKPCAMYISIKNFDSNLLKTDKKSHKNIDIYYIGCITMKDLDYGNIHSANSLYIIFDKVDRYIRKSNGNKCLIFASADKIEEVLTKYTEL